MTGLTVAALLLAAGYWVRRVAAPSATQLVSAGAPLQAPANRVVAALTPRIEAACHLAMSVGMATMFLAML